MKIKNISKEGLIIPDEKGILFTIRAGEEVEWKGDINSQLIQGKLAAKQLEVTEEDAEPSAA